MNTSPLMIDLSGLVLTDDERARLAHPWVGGLILFARNYADKAQLKALIAAVRAVRPTITIAVDQEGGRVQRFQDGFTRLPSLQAIGQRYDDDHQAGLAWAKETGERMAAELVAVGIDLSFAPVLDLAHPDSDVLKGRCFHHDPAAVVALAREMIAGMHAAGLQAVGKHFPGHGGVVGDTHHEIVEDHRLLSELESADLYPYQALAEVLDGVMTAHVRYPAIDDTIATFSPFWIQTQLRERLGFKGRIFSDDLSMNAALVHSDPVSRVRSAIEAGCDTVLLCNDPKSVERVLNQPMETIV